MLGSTIISYIALAAAAAAAPQSTDNGALRGAYICPRANFAGDAVGTATACVWKKNTKGSGPGDELCQPLPRFGMSEEAERHISFSPDVGNFCVLFESQVCNKTQAGIFVRPPGFHDLWEKHLVKNTTSQYKAYLCSDKSEEEPMILVNKYF